jgi:hypothetical protein
MTSKEWYAKNRSYEINYKRMWRVDNPEKAKAIDKRHREKHKESRNQYCREYYYKNRDRLLAYQKRYYHNHKKK